MVRKLFASVGGVERSPENGRGKKTEGDKRGLADGIWACLYRGILKIDLDRVLIFDGFSLGP
jgi:hypothetical protein